ncbi:hypothetical protein EXIGLDRAFT_259603 [Exidia glandulosa HHB12029]|uniref:Uncharacterized protein n=1 Tax=Exidia glandulosa HHB12029 TaxID=1314781 RepID=A0A165MEJ8_EXIGL|nr:hypothetical protein EXIGLDRAFT_259603 [Exidia glandulosa HHB12029]
MVGGRMSGSLPRQGPVYVSEDRERVMLSPGTHAPNAWPLLTTTRCMAGAVGREGIKSEFRSQLVFMLLTWVRHTHNRQFLHVSVLPPRCY